jgi:hypothetical protein
MLEHSSHEPVASERTLSTQLSLEEKDADDMRLHAGQT